MNSYQRSEEEDTICVSLAQAIESRDFVRIRQIIRANSVFLTRSRSPYETGAFSELDLFLSLSASRGDFEMLKLLVECGANIHTSEYPTHTEGVIYDVASFGSVDMARWLVSQGAVVNDEYNGQRWSGCLMVAAMDGRLEMVKYLIEQGALVNGIGGHEQTPLDRALPHERKIPLPTPAVIANSEPPKPFASNTRLSCWWIIDETEAWSEWTRPDGEKVRLLLIYPLYDEERLFEKEHGTRALMQRLVDADEARWIEIKRDSAVSDF